MDFLHFTPKLQALSHSMNIPMEPKTLALLIATLFFLISLLVNLLQHRYFKRRFNRMLRKEEELVNFLVGTDKNLGDLEWNCTIELKGAFSMQEAAKVIHGDRKKIESTIADMRKHLQSFRQYRKKEKARAARLKSSSPTILPKSPTVPQK